MIDRTAPPDRAVLALVDTLTDAADARLGEGQFAREVAFGILDDCGARAGEASLGRDAIEIVMEALAGLGGAQITTRQMVCTIVPILSDLPLWPRLIASAAPKPEPKPGPGPQTGTKSQKGGADGR